MDSDKEVNQSAKNLTPFSIADILSSSKSTAADPPAAVPPANPPTPPPTDHPYPWFLFNHPSWPSMMPGASSSSQSVNGGPNGQAGSSSLTASPEEEEEDSDAGELFDDEEDGSNSIIGSLTSTDDGQQEDPLDMRASPRHHHRRSRSRKFLLRYNTPIEKYTSWSHLTWPRAPTGNGFTSGSYYLYLDAHTRVSLFPSKNSSSVEPLNWLAAQLLEITLFYFFPNITRNSCVETKRVPHILIRQESRLSGW